MVGVLPFSVQLVLSPPQTLHSSNVSTRGAGHDDVFDPQT